MATILHDLPIQSSPETVFRAVSSIEGLSNWWIKSGSGTPELGNQYQLDFGPGYVWRAQVTEIQISQVFELKLVHADDDWTGTVVRFEIRGNNNTVRLRFEHQGWPAINDHFRTSSYCWAMYLRCLKRYVEMNELVDYENRLDN